MLKRNEYKDSHHKLFNVSEYIRRADNQVLKHERIISKKGVPYLKFKCFHLVYYTGSRSYTIHFSNGFKKHIVSVPKQRVFNSHYPDKVYDALCSEIEVS